MTKRTNTFVAILLAATCASTAVHAYETTAFAMQPSTFDETNFAVVQGTLSAQHHLDDVYQEADLRFETLDRPMNAVWPNSYEGDWLQSGSRSQISKFWVDVADIRQETLD
jgi:hypothetical protein